MSSERLPLRCTLDAAARERFAAGESEPAERGTVLRHLLAGCADCAGAVRSRVTLLKPREEASFPMTRVLASLAETERRIRQERAEAAELWNDFVRHPPQRQWTLLRNSGRYALAEFAELLLEASFEEVYDEPRRSLDLAEMARHVVEGLEAGFRGERSLRDLRGRAWGRLANARRANSDLLGAEQAIAQASVELDAGSGEPLAEAEHLYFSASIHRAQRRFDAARRALSRSRRLYRLVGDRHLEGRSMLNEALIQELDGDLPGAIDRIRRAIPMIDPARDRHLALGARHNLLWCLTASGRGAEALHELEALRPKYVELGDRMALIRLRWMEGRIALQLGRPEGAEAAFRDAMDSFVEAAIPYEAATVALDLAALLADQRRTVELKRLAGDLVAVFHRLGVEREAVAALMLFERAARAEKATSAMVASLARWFERTKASPAVPFSFEESPD